jgi:hypothetical protein
MYLLGDPQTGAVLMDGPGPPPVFLGYVPSWHVYCTQCGLLWEDHPHDPRYGGRICRILFGPVPEIANGLQTR